MRRVAGLAVRAADAALGTWRAPGALQRLGVEAAEARGLFPAFSRGFSADGAAPEAQPAAADPPQPRMKLQLVKDDRPLRPWEVPREPKVVELPKSALSLEKRERQQGSRRSGLLAVKCGMTCEWTEWGERLPLTVLWIDDCQARCRDPHRLGFRSPPIPAPLLTPCDRPPSPLSRWCRSKPMRKRGIRQCRSEQAARRGSRCASPSFNRNAVQHPFLARPSHLTAPDPPRRSSPPLSAATSDTRPCPTSASCASSGRALDPLCTHSVAISPPPLPTRIPHPDRVRMAPDIFSRVC